MKTQIKKFNIVTKALSLAFMFSTLTVVTQAMGKLDHSKSKGDNSNSIKTEISKDDKSNSALELNMTPKNIEKSFYSKSDLELSAITMRISETVKFRVNPDMSDFVSNNYEAELDTITEEIAKTVKYEPTYSL